MPYPRKLLNTGEQIALDLHPHVIFFAETALALLGALALTIVLLIGPGDNWASSASSCCSSQAAWFGISVYQVVHYTLRRHHDRVIYRHGVFGKMGIEIPLERVMNVNFDQSFWERIVGRVTS